MITDLRALTEGERAAWELEDAQREFRLFASGDNPASQGMFDRIKTLEAAYYRTAEGINWLVGAGHAEKATAEAIKRFGYRGNGAAVRARAQARMTAQALTMMEEAEKELAVALGELSAAKQARTKARAQEKIDAALERLVDLAKQARQHADAAAREAVDAVERSQRFAHHAPSAKRANMAGQEAQVKASGAEALLERARKVVSEDSTQKESLLPTNGDELLAEADLLDESDYDDYQEDGEVEFF